MNRLVWYLRISPGKPSLVFLIFWTLVLGRGTFFSGLSAQDTTRGQQIFQQKCVACHTIGEGKRVGPDLLNVTNRRDIAWLKEFISAPGKMIRSGDPVAAKLFREFNNITMPDPGLSAQQIQAVIAYLASQSKLGAAQQPPVSAQQTDAGGPLSQVSGNPATGRKLFTGEQTLQNGGAPCIACHTFGSLSSLEGGRLGPDLTTSYPRYGKNGIVLVLQNIAFPTMQPVYGSRPLTDPEIAHLRAFFEANQTVPPAGVARINLELLGFGFGGFLLLLMIGQFLWRKRNGGVRRALLETRYQKGGQSP